MNINLRANARRKYVKPLMPTAFAALSSRDQENSKLASFIKRTVV